MERYRSFFIHNEEARLGVASFPRSNGGRDWNDIGGQSTLPLSPSKMRVVGVPRHEVQNSATFEHWSFVNDATASNHGQDRNARAARDGH